MKRKSQKDHDALIKAFINRLVSKNFYNIKADIPGYDTPTKINWKGKTSGHIPDVTADGKKFLLVEIETDDSINDEHTADQWKLFSAYADLNNADFIIVVPRGSETNARTRARQLELKRYEVQGNW